MSEPQITAIDLFGIMGMDVDAGPSPPQFAIAWDPSLISPEEYAELCDILGDLVRANGGTGIRRVAESEIEHQ